MSTQEKNPRICTSSIPMPSSIYSGYYFKLNTYDWLGDIPLTDLSSDLVEVRFKNTRKGFYKNINHIRLQRGDIVAVEAAPGHDIGIVSLTGDLVLIQMKKNNISTESDDFKKIYRKAKEIDIGKWEEAINLEDSTMFKARKIADDLKLEMKIGDVEYQGDKTKAIFYYIADERVDFRELIKVLAEEFKVRIEMRQIGARQEAGRIGGIGPCGRELCCASWITNFVSVTTNSARYQELSLNPQKLAGQCGKLKCCLNYELDCYVDAQKDYPDKSVPLETENGIAYHQKTDIFRGIMWYSFDKESTVNLTPVSVERVTQVQELNKNGTKVPFLIDKQVFKTDRVPDFEDVVGQESANRFQKKQIKPKKGRKKKNK
jgi:cell fate regulator YaaT (PSP1 superfamily)